MIPRKVTESFASLLSMVDSKADQQPSPLNMLNMLNANLNEEYEPDPVMQREYRDEQKFPVSRLENLANSATALFSRLPSDGGQKLRKQQQLAKAELERRKARSKQWLTSVRSCETCVAGALSHGHLSPKQTSRVFTELFIS